MRKKTLIGFLILSLLVIAGSTLLTAFLSETQVSQEFSVDVESKMIKDICVSAISVFGILITIFISASGVPAEMENKVIYTILSKPVRRFQYLLGKFLGIQLIIILNLLLMTLLFFIALYVKQSVLPTLLLWSALLTYFQFLIVSAFTFAISCTSTSSVLPTIAGLFIFIIGNLTEYLKGVSEKAAEAEGIQSIIGHIASGLYKILPNLRNFDLRNQILYLQPDDPPADIMIPRLIAYGLAYAISGFILAYWLFRRKEL